MSDNKKCAVVYRSAAGHTKAYAQWIAKDLKCDLFDGKKVKVSGLLSYDTIIFGGSLHAGGLNGIKLIIENFDQLKSKKLIVFAVGAAPVRNETTEELFKMNFPGEMGENIQFFYLRGGFDYSRLSLYNKFLMTLFKYKLKRIKNPDADQKGMLASYSHPMDFTNKKYIEPIIRSVEV